MTTRQMRFVAHGAATGLLALCSVAGLLACTQSSDKRGVIVLLLKTQDNPFFQAMEIGVQNELRRDSASLRLLVRSGTEEGDVSTQRQVLQQAYLNYVAQQTDPTLKGVLLTPAGSQSELLTEVRQLRSAGVRVVALDTRISDAALRDAGTDIDAFVGSNNEDGGRLAATFILAHSGAGKVLLLNGVDGQETARARRDGFVKAMGIAGRTVVERTANWRRDEARSTVAGISAMGQRFVAIFAANDEMALGAIEGLRQGNIRTNSVVLVGFDAIPEARNAVAAGDLAATIAQDPARMGQRGVEILREFAAGRSVPRDQLIPVRLVTRDSL